MCQFIICLLHKARNSGVKSSAGDLHHYSLEVSTLRLLSRKTESHENATHF